MVWACALAVAFLTALPGVYLVVRAGDVGIGGIWEVYTSSRVLSLLGASLVLVIGTTVLAGVLGVSTAFLVERTTLPGRGFWRIALALPLAMPSYVAAYAWVSTVRAEGLWWSVLVLGVGTSPYVFLSVSAALRRANQNAEDVAHSLGLSPAAVFWRVTFPHLRLSLAAGCLLVALYTLSDFGAVSLLRYDSFTRAIFMSYRASFDRTAAAVLALILMVVTLAITWAEIRMRGRSARADTIAHRNSPPARLNGWTAPALGLVGLVVGSGVVYPMTVVIGWAMAGRSRGLDFVDLGSAAWATLWICAVAAALTTLLCLPVGWLAARQRGRLITAVQNTLYVAHALPGLVVALAMVFFSIRYLQPLYQRTPVLILGYLVLFAPLAVGGIRSAVAHCSPRLEEVSVSLGLGSLETFRRVTLPLAAPGVAAAFVLVMLTAMKELPATLLLRPTGTETLATRLWMYTDELAYAAAAPYGLALIMVATIPTLVLTAAQLKGGSR